MIKVSLLAAFYSAAVTASDTLDVTSVLPQLAEATAVFPSHPTLVSRQTADDPYCPEGWMCDPEPCVGVTCPDGQYCRSWEGTMFCLDETSTVCRINLSDWLSFGCVREGAECCRGSCLDEGADCCDFFDPSCDPEVNQRCGQCAAGRCGANGCLTSSTTTSSVSISTTQTTTTSTSSTIATTSPASPGESTATTSTSTSMSTTTSSSTTTTVPPTPTIVPGVGTFVYRSCLVDIWDARVLVGDSDDSESMIVQRCVEVAQAGYWRYAGVEFGTQCYVGNTLHGPDQFPDSDCSQACAGDATQACGEAGRIQVYEDLNWKNPTIDELIAAVQRYNATMEDARAVIASYQGHVKELEDFLQSQSSRKRQAQEGEEIEMKVRKDYNDLEAVQSREASDREAGNEALTHSLQRDTFGTANSSAPLPQDLFEEWGITGENLSRYLGQIRARISGWLDEFQRAQQAGSTPQIDTAAAAAEVEVALQAIGTAFALAVTTGFFLVLDSIVSFFKGLFSGGGGGGGGEQTSTTTTGPTTTTSTTTTTTSTCTATATSTPVAVFAASGASADDFNALIDTLPDDPGSLTITESWIPNYLYTGYVDGCSLEKLAKDPIVSSWLITQGSQSVWEFERAGSLSCPLSSTSST